MALSTTFTHCAQETTKFGKIAQNKGHFALRGHSRSPILVLILLAINHQLYFTKTGRDKKNNKTDKKSLTRKT